MDEQPPNVASTGSSALRGVLLVLICAPLVGLGQFVAHARPDEMDAYLFAVFGRELLGGAVLYRDLWDIKPPGIFWINALGLWLGGGSLVGVWALCGAALAGSLVAINRCCTWIYDGKTAFLATLIAAVHLPYFVFHVGGNRPATFFVFTELVALALYVRASIAARRAALWLVFAGAFAGLGFCIKQTVLAAAVAFTLHLCYCRWCAAPTARGVWNLRIGVFVAGWLVAVVTAVVVLALTADLSWALDAIVLQPLRGVNLRGQTVRLPPVAWIAEYAKPFTLPLILAVAVAIHALLQRRAKPETKRISEDRALPLGWAGMLCGWFAIALALSLIGVAKRPWYLAVALPPLMMLAAHAVYLLLDFARRIPVPQPAFPAVVAVIWLVVMLSHPLRMQVEMAHRRHYLTFEAAPDAGAEQLIEVIDTYTGPDDPIFLSGYRPDIYWRTGRPLAGRYVGTIYAGWLGMDNLMNQRLVAALRANPPQLLRCGQIDASSPHGQALQEWLQNHYRPLVAAGVTDMWLRADEP